MARRYPASPVQDRGCAGDRGHEIFALERIEGDGSTADEQWPLPAARVGYRLGIGSTLLKLVNR